MSRITAMLGIPAAPQSGEVVQWGSQERAVFFRPWWRAALTLTLAAIPIALTPLFASSPETGTWLGPVSILPLFSWIGLGLFRIRRQRTMAGARPAAEAASQA